MRRGGRVLGICGGYQMLGRTIADPDGVEGRSEIVAGLGLLPVETVLAPVKHLAEVRGISIRDGAAFAGYEMHAGRTVAFDGTVGLLRFDTGVSDGAVNDDGRIAGCYVHRLFDHPAQRAAWLSRLGVLSDGVEQRQRVDATLDALADALDGVVDIDTFLAIAATAA